MTRIIHKMKLGEISAVDRPAQTHAKAVIMKRADDVDDSVVSIAKAFVEEDANRGTADFGAEITKRAAIAFPDISSAQAFVKYATSDETGKILFQAMTKAERTVTQAAQDLPPQKSFGPATDRLNEITLMLARAKSMSFQEAHGRVAVDPAHADLVRRAKEEARRATAAVTNQRAPIARAARALSS